MPGRHDRGGDADRKGAGRLQHVGFADTLNTGNTPPVACLNRLAAGGIASMPRAPPITLMTIDSPNTSSARNAGPKPSALSVAYSTVRSRALIAIALAITAMMITITTYETTRIAAMI